MHHLDRRKPKLSQKESTTDDFSRKGENDFLISLLRLNDLNTLKICKYRCLLVRIKTQMRLCNMNYYKQKQNAN